MAVPHNTPCVCLSHDNPTLFCILLPNYPLLMQNTNFFCLKQYVQECIANNHWRTLTNNAVTTLYSLPVKNLHKEPTLGIFPKAVQILLGNTN